MSDCEDCKDQKYEIFVSTKEIKNDLFPAMRKIGIGSSDIHSKLMLKHYENEEDTILYIGEQEPAGKVLRELLFAGIMYAKLRKHK